jgi:hypothetical protein
MAAPPPIKQSCAVPADDAATIAGLRQDLARSQQKVADLQHRIDDINAPVYAKYRATEMASYDEKISLYAYRVHLYKGQDFSGAVIMWMSVAVVAVGLILSAAQLIVAMRVGRKDDGTIDVSLTGIKVTSSVTGLIILAMSLAFTYIFIEQVYTIHPPDIHAVAEPQKLNDHPAMGK